MCTDRKEKFRGENICTEGNALFTFKLYAEHAKYFSGAELHER